MRERTSLEKKINDLNAFLTQLDDIVLLIEMGESENDEDVERELTDFEKRLAKDYQLQRAIDLIRGVSLYKESIE